MSNGWWAWRDRWEAALTLDERVNLDCLLPDEIAQRYVLLEVMEERQALRAQVAALKTRLSEASDDRRSNAAQIVRLEADVARMHGLATARGCAECGGTVQLGSAAGSAQGLICGTCFDIGLAQQRAERETRR